MGCDSRPGVVDVDDVITPSRCDASDDRDRLFLTLRWPGGRWNRNFPGQNLCTASVDYRLTSAKLQLLADADGIIVPAVGLVVVGVPIGSDYLVRNHMCDAAAAMSLPTVARGVAAIEDTQMAVGDTHRPYVLGAEDCWPGAECSPAACGASLAADRSDFAMGSVEHYGASGCC